jgi:hypothetical protein
VGGCYRVSDRGGSRVCGAKSGSNGLHDGHLLPLQAFVLMFQRCPLISGVRKNWEEKKTSRWESYLESTRRAFAGSGIRHFSQSRLLSGAGSPASGMSDKMVDVR